MHTRFELRTGGKRAQKMASWTITITAPTGAFDATLPWRFEKLLINDFHKP
jgi:hypothetical protein